MTRVRRPLPEGQDAFFAEEFARMNRLANALIGMAVLVVAILFAAWVWVLC